MTPRRLFFLSNQIVIDGFAASFVAGSLSAVMNGDTITVMNAGNGYDIAALPWNAIADQTGATFAAPADALAYVQGQFAQRRSLDIPTATAVAAIDLPMGTPVAILRNNQQITAARADSYALSFVAGLAAADIAAGFVGNVTRNPVTVPDWTALADSQSLLAGQPYFLAPTGGLTISPPNRASATCLACLGYATAPQTFLFHQSDPLTL